MNKPFQHDETPLFMHDSLFLAQVDSFYATLYDRYQPKPHRSQPVYKRFAFDPNTLDSLSFLSLGFPTFTVRNILRYRSAGGRFFTPKAFGRVYGIDTSLFNQLLPYIEIDTLALAKRYTSYYYPATDTLRSHYPKKFQQDTVIELNRADTALLMRIPGIGSAFARKLISYRDRLGGYRHLDQIREVAGVTDSIFLTWQDWLQVDSTQIRKIEINNWSLTKLYRHPYLNFYQAKVLFDLRKEYGNIQHLDDFSLMEEFSPSDLKRLAPYLDYSPRDNSKYPSKHK